MIENTESGLRLQWGPKEIEDLQSQVAHLRIVVDALNDNLDAVAGLIDHMKSSIENAPCIAARPGELTYECRHDNLCRVCQWRKEALRVLREEWGTIGS